jgi:hypothetical protein
MNTRKVAAKVASTAIVLLIPLGAFSSAASASQTPSAGRSAPNPWASRTSGLPGGGAALLDGLSLSGGPAFYNVPAAAAQVTQVAPNAWWSRTSGLQGGGAALFV